ncbi:MAG: hypothetical protein M0R51_12605 [Clostridia bacterium]|jgi:hypothetical protein|nr:hypothetical protein [Clostridia bacterium]
MFDYYGNDLKIGDLVTFVLYHDLAEGIILKIDRNTITVKYIDGQWTTTVKNSRVIKR